MFDCVPKRSLLSVKKKETMYNFIQFYITLKMLPYVCFLFLLWVKFCCVLDRFFLFGRQKMVVAGCVRQMVF